MKWNLTAGLTGYKMAETFTIPESADSPRMKLTLYIEGGTVVRTITDRRTLARDNTYAGADILQKKSRKGVKAFTDTEAVLIRLIVNSRVMNCSEAAKLFGVSKMTIWRLVTRNTYRGAA